MKIRNLLGLVAAVTMCGMANANEVDTASVTTFSSGTAALASEVNGNFDALITAINDNAARIAALENPSNSVAGHTYSLFFAGSFLAAEVGSFDSNNDGVGDQPEFGSVEEYAGQGSMTFNAADNAGSGTAQDTAGAELGIGNGGNGIWYDNNGADTTSDTLTLSWSQNGNVVTVDIAGEDFSLNFVVSEDGSMLVGQGTGTGTETFDDGSQVNFSDISTVILVRD